MTGRIRPAVPAMELATRARSPRLSLESKCTISTPLLLFSNKLASYILLGVYDMALSTKEHEEMVLTRHRLDEILASFINYSNYVTVLPTSYYLPCSLATLLATANSLHEVNS